MTEFYGQVPSGEMIEFSSAEREAHLRALHVLRHVNATLEDREEVQHIGYIKIDSATRYNPVLLNANPAGEQGDYATELRMRYQVNAPTLVKPPFITTANVWYRLCVYEGSDRKMAKKIDRPGLLATGVLYDYSKPFVFEAYGLPYGPGMQELAHNPEEKEKQREYAGWLELMENAVCPPRE